MDSTQVKLVEIRDRATFIPAVAIRVFSFNRTEKHLFGRVGYSNESPQVILMKLGTLVATYESWRWDNRTMTTAHEYIIKEWGNIEDGDVIDVEYILGETTKRKLPDRLENE